MGEALIWRETMAAWSVSSRCEAMILMVKVGIGRPKTLEAMVDAAHIRPGLDHAGGKQSLDLGSKQQPVAVGGVLTRPVKGADARPIASQDQSLAVLIPEGDGELATQVLEHSFLMIFPQV